ncbi:TlpA family protein disulfide reductase [Mucilaginibacter sp. UR6-1]|uniref:peroxiredoxin family protein n=1 Tax=Mucilaginibacter sp. UR6-1 TaxID=1435643 RepID=UPI001E326907|nr:TlpA disulfide reductase family protein [Mucilaginibacter sp. UR6-1]MCC8409730.1 TlpA family protein disulfide reductase [Mucilaginibacter sp. UR6-1]
MSTLKTIFVLISLCLLSNFGFSQPKTGAADSLSGYITLNIDVATLKDTAGVFKVRFGGETVFPVIKDGRLTVKHYLKEPRRAYLTFYPRDSIKVDPNRSTDNIVVRYNDYYTFFSHPGNFNITVNNFINTSRIENPSQYQKDYANMELKLSKFQENFWQLNADKYAKLRSATGKLKDSLSVVMQNMSTEAYRKHYDDVVLPYIKSHPDSPTALHLLEEYSYTFVVNYDALELLYNNFTDRIKALPSAHFVYNAIDRHQFQTNLLGKVAPDFSLKDVAGKEVVLKSFRGNVTLIEFWASWCGPCRANNPGLVKVYNKFKAKGFKILGISLDRKKDDWLKAIKTDGLTWTHVSDLKFWNGDVSKMYHVTAIPINYLIDKDGKVLAKNLNEKALEEQLAKLL